MRNVLNSFLMLVILSPAAFADEQEDVKKAGEKAAALKSYAFKMEIEIEGSPMPLEPFELSGTTQGDVTHVSGSMMGRDIEVYKKGEKVANLNQDGEWELMQRGGGRGPMGQMGRRLNPPHEELKGFEKKFKKIEKAEEKEAVDGVDCNVYKGEMTKEGAMGVFGEGRMGRMGDAEMAGNATLWIDAEGVVRKYSIVIDVIFDMQGNEIEMTISRVVSLSKLNDATIEIPAEVKTLFDAKEDKGNDPMDEEEEDH